MRTIPPYGVSVHACTKYDVLLGNWESYVRTKRDRLRDGDQGRWVVQGMIQGMIQGEGGFRGKPMCVGVGTRRRFGVSGHESASRLGQAQAQPWWCYERGYGLPSSLMVPCFRLLLMGAAELLSGWV